MELLRKSLRLSRTGLIVEFSEERETKIVPTINKVYKILVDLFSVEPSIWAVPHSAGPNIMWTEDGIGFFAHTDDRMELSLEWREEPGWSDRIKRILAELNEEVIGNQFSTVKSLSIVVVYEIGDKVTISDVLNRYFDNERLGDVKEVDFSWVREYESDGVPYRLRTQFSFSSTLKNVMLKYTIPQTKGLTHSKLDNMISEWLSKWGEIDGVVSW